MNISLEEINNDINFIFHLIVKLHEKIELYKIQEKENTYTKEQLEELKEKILSFINTLYEKSYRYNDINLKNTIKEFRKRSKSIIMIIDNSIENIGKYGEDNIVVPYLNSKFKQLQEDWKNFLKETKNIRKECDKRKKKEV